MSALSAAPPPGGESPGPGSGLRREREKRGLGVVEAAEKLHLDPSVVEALESDRFAAIGPAVFAKGHLKQYAALLNLPAEQVMAAYEAVQRASRVGAQSQAVDDAANATPFPKIPPLHQLPLLAKLPPLSVPVGIALIALLLVASALLWWKPWHHRGAMVAVNSQGAVISAAAMPAQPDADAAAASPDALGAPQPPVGADGAAAPSAAIASPLAGRVRLRMSFSADSWVDVRDAGGVTVYRGKGAANSVKSLAGAAPLSVYLGYVSGVQLEINNHAVAIGPQFVRGDVARFEAGADGVLRRAPRP